jgi:hypothetical protein
VVLILIQTSVWMITSLVSFFKLCFEQGYGAGSDAGQLAIVPSPVVAT